ncbi:AAA family ATPase [Minwuia thermotolerans]|jgi:hypothetical protein|uniref:DNA transposition protein n=1 Tax=Minwuia thermotolerans TaxID=2056226 RepID=A0A2M9G0R1_9PROT|nr:AAA family ATPase [Minwuia thermotolerans]ANK79416.1 MAG: hypothetical protein TEF_00385 [Rhizobiales bacterium NRL2]PJK29307.1 DNA transposition protein [Minwuia thermotolerans]PJK30509.1 DNA transposition protein [Minwuia thermotolerans]PJK30732.1 DNA transposition protein [Minwuia thermotolerans]
MNAPKDQTLTDAEIEAIRAEAKKLIADENLSHASAARDAGIAAPTMSAWLSGTYTGRNDNVAGKVQLWLASREERKRARSSLPQAPMFVKTRTASSVTDVLQWAQIGPDIVVVAGGAGIGKTTACGHYAGTNPNVWMATMQPSTANVYPMLQVIAQALQLTEKSPTKLPEAIGARVRDTGGLLIVDEAQHLVSKALDQLRSLHDLYGVGIALVGNESVYGRLQGEGRRPEFAQLFSRIGMRFTRGKPWPEDVCELIGAWKVTDPDTVRLLKAVATKPGALRGMTKVLRIASAFANSKGEPLNVTHVSAAWKRLSEDGGDNAQH